MLKKGQEYIGVVEQVDFPNKGIVKVEGDRVIVKNTVPGQHVRFIVNKCKKGKAEARLIEVIGRAEIEREAACPHFGSCGGCTFQTMPYEAQCEMKAEQVKRMLDEAVTAPYEFEGIIKSPCEYGYRNKMEFSFGDEVKGGALALGLHKRGSFYDIVSVSSCKIVHEDYNKILTCVLTLCKEYGLSYFHRIAHTGYLRHLLVRRAVKTGDILINLITTSEASVIEEDLLKELTVRLTALPLEGKIAGILHTVNDRTADVVQSDRTELLYGQDFFYEKLLGLTFKISTFSFFQTNSLGAELVYETVREYIGDTKDQVVFDLYSGTGTIAQLLASVAKQVTGVELVEEAVEAAKENAHLNGLENCDFIAGDVLKVLGTITARPDLIVLDPPRDGIHPKALERIIDYGVERMVYISCKPSSLCRDLKVLQERGYRVVKAKCMDMFPMNGNVETVVLLSLKTGTPKIEVTMEVDSDSNYSSEE